jgi:hypothetical protein
VPVIVEKIVEKIVVMPQIVEVLKFIYDIAENENIGVALEGEIGADEAEYQRLGKNVNGELIKLRTLLKDLQTNAEYQ